MSNNFQAIAEKRGGWFAVLAALAWCLLVFALFFSSLPRALPHLGSAFDFDAFPPEGVSRAVETLAGSLQILLVSFLVLWAILSWGRHLIQWLGLNLPNPWLKWSFDFGAGILFFELYWTGTGLARLWYQPFLFTVAALFFLLPFWRLLRALMSAPALISAPALSTSLPRFSGNFFTRDASTLFLLCVGLFYWIFAVLQNLAPETFFDAMVYHLAVPQYWLINHGFRDFPGNFFSNYPFGAECYFLNGLVFQGTEAAKMLHVISYGFCGLVAGGWAWELAGPSAGRLALGATLTLPLLALNSWAAQVEGFLAFGLVLGLYALNRFAQPAGKPAPWALASGLLLGLCLCVKYTAIIGAGSALLVLAFQNRVFFARSRMKYWAMALLACLLMLGPWIIKNLVYTGNPFFPYFMDFFTGRHLSPEGYSRLLVEQHARVTTGWLDWLWLPWKLTFSNPDSYNFCGPLWLALLPLCFLFRLKHAQLRFLAVTALLFLIAGLAVTHIFKFILTDFPLFYVLLAAVLCGGDRPAWGKRAAWVSGLAGVLCFAYLAAISHQYYNCAGIWSGRQTRPQYLEAQGKITPYYAMARWISENLPKEAGVLVAGDSRGLYYDRFFLTNTVFDEQVLSVLARREKDAQGIAIQLKRMGVEYLAVNAAEGIRVSGDYRHYELTSAEWKKLDDFIQGATDPIYLQNWRGVYRLHSSMRKNPPKTETANLLLFFSGPACRFMSNRQKQLWQPAQQDLKEALELYPFSPFWKKLKQEFEQSMGRTRHG
jgi:4-amino-4-deoxy-L-arabinose transferase-like glycosyltransferase